MTKRIFILVGAYWVSYHTKIPSKIGFSVPRQNIRRQY